MADLQSAALPLGEGAVVVNSYFSTTYGVQKWCKFPEFSGVKLGVKWGGYPTIAPHPQGEDTELGAGLQDSPVSSQVRKFFLDFPRFLAEYSPLHMSLVYIHEKVRNGKRYEAI